MRALGRLTVLGAFTFALAWAEAATLEVRFEPPRFGIEDVASVVVRISDPPGGTGDVGGLELGELDNLELVGGPSRGSEFRFVNGVSSQAISFTYRVRAKAVGPAAIGPVSVTVGAEVLISGRATAEVVEGSVAGQSRGRPRPFDPFAEAFGRPQAAEGRLALRQLVSSRSVVQGQPVTVSVVLDSTVPGVEGFEWLEPPSYPGWWAQRVDIAERREPEVVDWDGSPAARYLIDQHVLIPLRSGDLVLPSSSARIGVRGRSLFSAPQVVERATGEVTVRVDERPSAPADFHGAVGDLSYRVEIEPQVVEFGQSALVTITLEGDGNLPLVDAPAHWPTCDGCEMYPPEEDSEVSVGSDGIRGRRQWRSTLLPRTWGRLPLSPLTLTVFDPREGRYRKFAFTEQTLEVLPPPPTPTPTATAHADQVEGASPAVESSGDSLETRRPAVASWWPVVGALAVGLAGGGLISWLMSRRRMTAVPPRRPDQSPSERARELQLTLERWWLDARRGAKADLLRDDMETLRRELEAVRFAPGRADHSNTVEDLEDRLRRLLRRA